MVSSYHTSSSLWFSQKPESNYLKFSAPLLYYRGLYILFYSPSWITQWWGILCFSGLIPVSYNHSFFLFSTLSSHLNSTVSASLLPCLCSGHLITIQILFSSLSHWFCWLSVCPFFLTAFHIQPWWLLITYLTSQLHMSSLASSCDLKPDSSLLTLQKDHSLGLIFTKCSSFSPAFDGYSITLHNSSSDKSICIIKADWHIFHFPFHSP